MTENHVRFSDDYPYSHHQDVFRQFLSVNPGLLILSANTV
ncbi:hypothetical protein HNP81_002210 [Peribacillus huizhouensis]|uniref:Uncharacterized protein n=1 Tax=Peribacillus huizhouensis TaxID=1501239 RepID=A0ABR6CQS0_9BACI|nr:hypothetical protein [Peribacillus huizhouensis]